MKLAWGQLEWLLVTIFIYQFVRVLFLNDTYFKDCKRSTKILLKNGWFSNIVQTVIKRIFDIQMDGSHFFTTRIPETNDYHLLLATFWSKSFQGNGRFFSFEKSSSSSSTAAAHLFVHSVLVCGYMLRTSDQR